MYDNVDKSGDMTVVTYSGDMESAWLDKASSLTVTGKPLSTVLVILYFTVKRFDTSPNELIISGGTRQ